MNLYFVLGSAALGLLLSGWLIWDVVQDAKRRQAVRISPDLLAEMRGEIIHNAVQRTKAATGQQHQKPKASAMRNFQ